MKRSAIISNKQGVYDLLHELPNDLKFKSHGILPHGIFTAGGAFVPTQEKKNLRSREIRK